MNCEIFVLLEELGFVSEAFNCVCSGQLVRSRVESAQHLEHSQELHPSLGACFQRPLSFLLQDQQSSCWCKALGKERLVSVKEHGEELLHTALSAEELRKFFLPEWLQSIEFQTGVSALNEVRTGCAGRISS